ncbi:MAG: hypothetical protein Q8P57_03795 [Candidatus Pacearchaeota archaeon]|nr:hypothetical protein [Candidatus Pacearchaeota archaeon]
MKMRLVVLLFATLMFLPAMFASFVSAEIFVAELGGVHNIGEELRADVNLIPNIPIASHFTVDLICGEIRTGIFNQYYNLNAGQQQNVLVNTQLADSYFTKIVLLNTTASSTSGNSTNLTNLANTNQTYQYIHYNNCYLAMSFGPENSASNAFQISKDILIDIDLGDKFNPGDSVEVAAIAQKTSELPVNGFFEIFVDSLGLYKSGTVSNGNVVGEFVIPTNARSGIHNLTMRVYETNFLGEITNEGFFDKEFRVNQIMKDLQIQVNLVNIKPEEDFIFSANTYDQAGDIILSDISLVVYEPKDFVYSKKLVKSGVEQKIIFALNQTPGYWKIEAIAGDLIKRKLFYLEELPRIQTSLINDTLIVKNIGNVDYEGPLEITIGSAVEVKHIDLKVGSVKRFKLYAPDGDYSVGVNDGLGAQVLGNSFLTGNAVRIKDVGAGFSDTLKNPWVWWLAILVFILIIIYVQIKRRFIAKKKAVMEGKNPFDTGMSDSIGRGTKENASVIVVKTQSQDSEHTTNTINRAIGSAKDSGAKVYVDGDYKIIILSQKLTKRIDNEVGAVKIARNIESILRDHNRRYRDKISFGIGVNDGEIISEIIENKFKFTTTGNLILGAKKIAQMQKGNVLLSESIHGKVGGEIKTQKTSDNFWEITRVVDRQGHEDFLNRFTSKRK